MIIFNIIGTVLISMIVIFFSIITIVTMWPLLFINKYKRFDIAKYIIIKPWVFLINNLLLFMKIKIIGKENVNPKRKTLYICNHQSWLDITTFIKYSEATALSKNEVKYIPFIGLITVMTGVLYFKREKRGERLGIIKEVKNLFDSGHSLCIFPEGTRTKNGELLQPNFAILKLCYKMGIPVVPAAIEGTRFILPRGRFYFKFFQKVLLKYNEPVYPENFSNSDDFCNACWNKVVESYEELRKNY